MILYHTTTLDAFKGIAQQSNLTFWCSHSQCMNDSQEVVKGLEITNSFVNLAKNNIGLDSKVLANQKESYILSTSTDKHYSYGNELYGNIILELEVSMPVLPHEVRPLLCKYYDENEFDNERMNFDRMAKMLSIDYLKMEELVDLLNYLPFIIKTKKWEAEKEFRLVMLKNNQEEHTRVKGGRNIKYIVETFPKSCLKHVYTNSFITYRKMDLYLKNKGYDIRPSLYID